MKTSASNKKVRDLITMIRDGKLQPQPDFQRRLVWTTDDKNFFLDTVLKQYPFPEIYLANGEVDLETGEGSVLLVDGLQRVDTLVQYFMGNSALILKRVPPYKDLSDEQKREFLMYDVAVRDLGSLTKTEIIEVFKRINSTKYSLEDIEINNAVYAGEMKKFAKEFSENAIFSEVNFFTSTDYKRMGDLRYALSIISAMLTGYSNRDENLQTILEEYNDDFPKKEEVRARIEAVVDFLRECGFDKKSRIWRKADLFTAFIEIDRLINIQGLNLNPSEVVEGVERFYKKSIDEDYDISDINGIYYKASIQGTNDKLNRIRRGIIFEGVITGKDESDIMNDIKEYL